MEKEASVSDSQTSEHDEEDDGSLESDEGLEGVGGAELGSRSAGTLSPFSSSAVKPEASCSSKSKKENPGRVGAAGEEAKVRGRPVGRPPLSPADRKQREVRPAARWRTGGGATCFGRSRGLKSVPSPGERLKKATRKSGSLQCILGKRSGRLETPPSQNDDISWSRRGRSKQVKGRAVSRLLESFAADEDFRIDEQSSFSEEEEEEEEDPSHTLPAVPDCVLTKERLVDGLKVLISKEDELLYAAYVHTLDLPDIYSVAIEGERGNRPRIYSLEQLLEEAVLDVRPESQAVLTEGTRVCAYWSERSRCLYPGYVHRGGPGEEEKDGCVMVEFDDGDRGWISLANVRLLPPGYQIHCAEPSPALLTSPGRQSRRSSAQEKTSQDGRNPKKTSVRGKPGRPKMVTSGTKACVSESVAGSNTSLLSWPAVAATRKRPLDLFHFNGIAKKTQRGRESDLFPLVSAPMSLPAKGIFSTSFEVDSFSSIANGYSSFGSQPLVHKSVPGGRGRRPGDRKEFLVKLDHEGVTSPKTKNGKALLLLGSHESGGARLERSFGSKGLADVSSSVSYSHPALPVKDSKKSSNGRAELLLKGSSHLRKPPPGLGIREYGDYCHSDCSYSDMDEEEDEDTRRAALVAARGELRSAGRFLSRLSVSSSSSGSSSSSSSGSLSSSSLCSSDNDSSYSSDDEETSRLMLQGCLSSRHALLQQQPQKPAEAPSAPARHAAFGVSGSKDNADGNPGKPGRRKDPPVLPPSKTSKDGSKKQKTASPESPPSTTPFLPARQLWRWSGNPTQRRGMKGKARKLFYKAVVRGKEVLRVGDCAVFLSAGRPQLPYIGRIESLWESWASNMVVKVKWFYHPEETKLGKRHRDGKHALYQSCHEDENDIQTISHKCQVVSREEYERLSRGRKPNSESQDLYYLAGTYDPTSGQLVTVDGVSIIC
ncbi:BAH and coiled-coil domain-containing protein 1-like [Denticeps clupeoides]|uniref:BAH and coiled-coil domain-containing protein 1-like n=1 Tax=Denticeps clupeoides TaxID=299321 RepID=UPI0010A376EA|nr:BAH and coiled-coil domain-containing protein 1-like [Denticeps clupeoides]